jgi:SAM-dependent methyltransferase
MPLGYPARVPKVALDTATSTAFYDELASYYDLIFADWGASMERQGETIARLLTSYLPELASPMRVLDAAAGIGTQSIPLAQRGFQVLSRDHSSGAIARLQREAVARGLSIDAACADMRTVSQTVSQPVDAVIAFDNAVPHLLTDDDLLVAFQSFYESLRPGGVCALSVRDYDQVERGADIVHPYGVRWRDGIRHLPLQVWHWVSPTHYEITFYLIVDEQPIPRVRCATTSYYAVPTSRLLALLAEAGFSECQRLDDTIYQPIIVARRP